MKIVWQEKNPSRLTTGVCLSIERPIWQFPARNFVHFEARKICRRSSVKRAGGQHGRPTTDDRSICCGDGAELHKEGAIRVEAHQWYLVKCRKFSIDCFARRSYVNPDSVLHMSYTQPIGVKYASHNTPCFREQLTQNRRTTDGRKNENADWRKAKEGNSCT